MSEQLVKNISNLSGKLKEVKVSDRLLQRLSLQMDGYFQNFTKVIQNALPEEPVPGKH